jgi:hypothetical protein
MDVNRREFLRLAGTVGAFAFTAPSLAGRAVAQGAPVASEIDALFDRAVVFDALAAGEQWDDPDPILDAYSAPASRPSTRASATGTSRSRCATSPSGRGGSTAGPTA